MSPAFITYGPPRPSPWAPLLVGGVALVGLVCTLLPMWSLTLRPSDHGFNRYDFDLETGSIDADAINGAASVDIGFYDWILSAAPAAAAIPIVLALAVATSTAQLLTAADRRMWGVLSAAALSAIIVVAWTAIRPQTRHEITGPLARELNSSDLGSITQPTPMDIGVGSGFLVTMVALLAVGALSLWQFIAASPRNRP